MKRLLTVLATLALTGPAFAQPGTISTQLFTPAPGGHGNYVTVQGSDVLEAWLPAVGFFLNYAHEPLILTRTDNDDRAALIEHQLAVDFMAAIGLFGPVELGVAIPMTLWQKEGPAVGSLQPTPIEAPVLGDIRLYPKVSFYHDPEGFGIALLAAVTLPTGSPEDLQGNDGVTVEPRLVLEYAFNDAFRLALNGGFVYRPEVQSLYTITVGNEVTFGAGLEYFFESANFALIGEGYGKISVESGATSQVNPIEVALAGRWWPSASHALTLGAARGLTDGYGSPNFRVYFGYNYSPRDETVETREPDTDKDGICDPWISREGKLDRYLGVCRGSDGCPFEPEDFDGHEDEDGCPDPDNDGDGLCDPWVAERGLDQKYAHLCNSTDACPNEAEDFDGFEDDDGCPDEDEPPVIIDSDGDGVPDDEDPCPNDPTDACTKVTFNPCEIVITEAVFFRTNRYEIEDKSFPLLNAVADVLTSQEWIELVEVQGHTDNEGGVEYNKTLSNNRARSVMDYLVSKGVDPERLRARGYGLEKPIEPNTTAEGRAKNRRVQFIIVQPSQADCPK